MNFNFLRNIWAWLNGKKTYIGTLVFFLAVIIQRNGLVNVALLSQLDNDVQTLAAALAFLGIGHKFIKWLEVKPTEGTTGTGATTTQV